MARYWRHTPGRSSTSEKEIDDGLLLAVPVATKSPSPPGVKVMVRFSPEGRSETEKSRAPPGPSRRVHRLPPDTSVFPAGEARFLLLEPAGLELEETDELEGATRMRMYLSNCARRPRATRIGAALEPEYDGGRVWSLAVCAESMPYTPPATLGTHRYVTPLECRRVMPLSPAQAVGLVLEKRADDFGVGAENTRNRRVGAPVRNKLLGERSLSVPPVLGVFRDADRELEGHGRVPGERGASALQRLAPASHQIRTEGRVEHGCGVHVGDVRHEEGEEVEVRECTATRADGAKLDVPARGGITAEVSRRNKAGWCVEWGWCGVRCFEADNSLTWPAAWRSVGAPTSPGCRGA